MNTTQDKVEKLLKERGLRVTAPRLAVLGAIADAQSPVSHSQMLELLGDTDWDPATIYRNLVKLRDAELILVVNRANGIDRYALARTKGDQHSHPHFVCEDCGEVSCLPVELVPAETAAGRWNASVQKAAIQLRGECPDCLDGAEG